MLSVSRFLKDSTALGGADINAYTVTNAALDYSESFAPAGMDTIGIALHTGSTATGTAPTIAAALEVSLDGGTLWIPVSDDRGDVTAATTGAIGTGTNIAFAVEAPAVESGVSNSPLYRWAFTYANADNDVLAVSAWLIMRKYGVRTP
jgi:hypothetical protein